MGRHGLHAAHPRAWEKHHVLPMKGVRSTRGMNRLIKALSQESDPKRKLQLLVYETKRSPHLFSGQQVLSLAPYFEANLIIALHLLDHHLLGLNCNIAHQILTQLQAPEQKLEALKVLSEHILDPVNRNELLSALPNIPVLRQQAQTILDQVRGSSHVYGRIKAKSAIFLIDVSGSMETEFRSECGGEFNRLEFVVHDLHKILHHRVPFNIFTFATDVQKFKWSQQFASRQNLKEAEHFLDHLQEGGGTNTHDALRTALQEPDIDTIYLLSDGEPTSGITDPNIILNDLRLWLSQRASPVQIHAIAFLMGHSYDDPKPRQLMGAIAAAGGGVFRCLDHFAPDEEDFGDAFESKLDLRSELNNDQDFQNFFNNRMAAVPQSALDACRSRNMISRPRNINEIAITKVEDHKLSGHHVYDVHVCLQGVVPDKVIDYTVGKLYNDFKALHTKVTKMAGGEVGTFPTDHVFQKHDQAFLETRRLELEAWLHQIYTTYGPFAFPELGEFLLYDTYVDEAIAEAVDIYQAHQMAQIDAQQQAQQAQQAQFIAPPPAQFIVPPPAQFIAPPPVNPYY